MKVFNFSRFIKRFFKIRREAPARNETSRVHVTLRPLTVGLRVDTTHQVSPDRITEVSQMIWISPARSAESVKTLKVVLHSN
jgi:hypothetical protein